jgi:hypothetical protein
MVNTAKWRETLRHQRVSGRLPEPIEAVEDQIEPKLERAHIIVAGGFRF